MPSQFGQDLFVLQVLGGMHNGFFLDSGAADGVSASNTLLLERSFGWKGICIEPNKDLFAALINNRQCLCVNCCLYDQECEVDFVEEARMLGGILGEYHPDHLRFARRTFHLPDDSNGKPPTVRKAARTLRSVLRDCGAPREIDYWSLDTEGSELSILKSFPFDEFSFRVLTVEHNRLPIRESIREFMERRGYIHVKALEIDDCYIRDATIALGFAGSAVWTRLGKGKVFKI